MLHFKLTYYLSYQTMFKNHHNQNLQLSLKQISVFYSYHGCKGATCSEMMSLQPAPNAQITSCPTGSVALLRHHQNQQHLRSFLSECYYMYIIVCNIRMYESQKDVCIFKRYMIQFITAY